MVRTCSLLLFCIVAVSANSAHGEDPISIGKRRELFVDSALISSFKDAELQLHRPRSAGFALKLDKPWEGELSGYVTVLKDGSKYRMYYRGRPLTGYGDGAKDAKEVTCVAISDDGIKWTRPDVGVYTIAGSKANNVILADIGPMTHNIAPFVDHRSGTPASERYKAVGGTSRTGLIAFVSADGLHWKQLREKPIITGGAFDSQNNVFWSEHEQRYICFFRTFRNGVRWITRTTSENFLDWTPAKDMSFGDAPNEHLYTNQTEPYFRAPHIYIGTAARFWPRRHAVSDAQVAALKLDGPKNYGNLKNGLSDSVLLSSRGGELYARTFLESLDRPGGDLRNWTARSNYPARGVVQTGPREMSMYIQRCYGQPGAHIERMVFRIDGFSSLHGPYRGGEATTKTITFDGSRLNVNMASSAAGGLRVEIQDANGKPIPGFALSDAVELVGDDLDKTVAWKAGTDVSKLAGKSVKLRFSLRDTDLFSYRFE